MRRSRAAVILRLQELLEGVGIRGFAGEHVRYVHPSENAAAARRMRRGATIGLLLVGSLHTVSHRSPYGCDHGSFEVALKNNLGGFTEIVK